VARTPYALGNPNGNEFGPITIPNGTEIAGIDGAEQFGFGIIDVRVQFRKNDGTPLPGTGNQTGWATGLWQSANFIGSIPIPSDEIFSGFWVQEQFGFGVVNFRLKKRKRANNSETPLSALVCGNMGQNNTGEVEIPPNTKADGVIVKVQDGYGVVNMAVEYD
jgi:hypothetical protein